MARVAVIGEGIRISGFALAGAETHPADDPGAVRAAWASLEPEVEVVVLTPAAAESLGERAEPTPAGVDRLTVVMP